MGTQTLSGTNISYSGATTINGGVLSVGTLAPNGNNSGIGKGTDLTALAERIGENADVLAFLSTQLGMTQPKAREYEKSV